MNENTYEQIMNLLTDLPYRITFENLHIQEQLEVLGNVYHILLTGEREEEDDISLIKKLIFYVNGLRNMIIESLSTYNDDLDTSTLVEDLITFIERETEG